MNRKDDTPVDSAQTRRNFLQKSALGAGAALGLLHAPHQAHGSGRERIRVGVCGTGGRGRGAAANALEADPSVVIVAVADLFEDRIKEAKGYWKGYGERIELTPEREFTGFDAYKKLLEVDLDICIFATPPGFRAQQVHAAIEKGVHVFAEKPVAVDPTSVRTFLEAAKMASKKGLSIVAGTQRRHQESYLETMKRIRGGEIGEVLSAQCYWNQGALWSHPRKNFKSDSEWQIRNWLYFTWLSGDHIVEQHVHNIDVVNWAFDAFPTKAIALGGRQSRTDARFGNIFDHFAVEFEYPGGRRAASYCRQQQGADGRIEEKIVGSLGTARAGDWIRGKSKWKYRNRKATNPYVQEHIDLIKSIRDGKPLNEGERIAKSTLCAIMGRMAAYTGKEVSWDFAMNSKLDLVPKNLGFGPLATPEIARPGITPLI